MLSISPYRQNTNKIRYLAVYDAKQIDKVIGRNLKRLRLANGLTQAKLGDWINVDGNVIAQLEGGIIGMGKDIMARLCNALKVEPADFYISEQTIVPATELEKKALFMARAAESAKLDYIAEEIVEYGKQRIERVKKEQKKAGADKSRKIRDKAG